MLCNKEYGFYVKTFNSSLKDTGGIAYVVYRIGTFNSSLKDTFEWLDGIVTWDVIFQFLIKGYAQSFCLACFFFYTFNSSLKDTRAKRFKHFFFQRPFQFLIKGY